MSKPSRTSPSGSRPCGRRVRRIMIRSIKAYRVLQGIRGKPPADIKAATLSILRLSAMVSNHPEIAELDINPLIVYPEGQGCVVADARIILSRR